MSEHLFGENFETMNPEWTGVLCPGWVCRPPTLRPVGVCAAMCSGEGAGGLRRPPESLVRPHWLAGGRRPGAHLFRPITEMGHRRPPLRTPLVVTREAVDL